MNGGIHKLHRWKNKQMKEKHLQIGKEVLVKLKKYLILEVLLGEGGKP